MKPSDDPTEERIREIGARLIELTKAETPQVTRTHRWEFQVMRWCMADDSLRTQVLRFIDCLPALHGSREIVRHLREYFLLEPSRHLPARPSGSGTGGPAPGRTKQAGLPLPLRLGLSAAGPNMLSAGAVAAVTRHTATAIAKLFLVGTSLEEASGTLKQLEANGFRLTCDLLGEATTSQEQADRYTQSYLDLIQQWNSSLSSSPHVSLKLSSLAFPFDPVDPEGAWRQVGPRFTKILRTAFRQKGFVNVDMEQSHLRDLILMLSQRALSEQFPNAPDVGVVVQAYLKDAQAHTHRLLDWVKARGTPITVRLVRGAYWDSEWILAQQRNWPCPVFTTKAETDATFETLSDLLLTQHTHVRVAIATHNLRSIARAIAKAQELNIPKEHWEIQMLYGMSEALQRAVLKFGIPVRLYVPIGELIPGMAYLVRRILENTSQYSFLAMGLMEEQSEQTALEKPLVAS